MTATLCVPWLAPDEVADSTILLVFAKRQIEIFYWMELDGWVHGSCYVSVLRQLFQFFNISGSHGSSCEYCFGIRRRIFGGN